MSRKVNVSCDVIVNVPVKMTVDLLIRADEGANLDRLIENYFKRSKKSTNQADVEDVTVENIEVPYDKEEFDFEEYLQDLAEGGLLKATVEDIRVTESR